MTMEELASRGNLHAAFKEVKANRGAPGIDGQSVTEVENHLEGIIEEVSRALLGGTYRPNKIRRVWIPKGGGGKRGLGIPTVIDRMVQQAILRVLQPHIDRTFDQSSHGFRPGRSAHSAIVEAKGHVEAGYEWVVDIDLEKFFDTVNHQRLLARLERWITDRRIILLIGKMLTAKVVLPEGIEVATTEGTPQGGPLSPLLANIVLDELDQELRRRNHRFVRYADDCNIYVRSRRAGERVMASVSHFIEKRLRLKVNQSKSAVAEPHERHFLGFRLIVNPLDSTVQIGLSARTKKRMSEKVVAMTPRNAGGKLSTIVEIANSYFKGWSQYFKVLDAKAEVERFMANTDAHMRRRLRAILLKQWKRKRVRLNKLVSLGVSKRAAGRAVYEQSRSLWALSATPAVHRALPNRFFASLGLTSLKDEWGRLNTVVVPVQLRFNW